MGAGGWGLGVRVGGSLWADGRRGNSIIVGVDSLDLTPTPLPVCPLGPGHCQSRGPEWIQPGRLESPALIFISMPPSTNIKQFHFQSRQPPRPPFTPNSSLIFPPRMQAHHHMGGRLTHLIVGAQLRITICLLGKMDSLLHCVP